MKAACKAKCSQHDEKYGGGQSRDEEGDVPLGSFDLFFCSIDFIDPDGVKIKNQGRAHTQSSSRRKRLVLVTY